MNDSYSDLVKEAYAACPDVILIDTLEVSCPSVLGTFYLAKAYKHFQARLEDDTVVTFKAVPFRFTRPGTGEHGLQELTFSIDNVDRRVSDFFLAAKRAKDPVVVKFRIFAEGNLDVGPENDPPLTLYLKDVKISTFVVTCRATFVDLVNKRFPSEVYTRTRFPGLGDA